MTALHGGPDAFGVPRWDFSTNANACGPCPTALEAVQRADPRHYPDPAYTALRAQLASHHGVSGERIVLAGSASEFISRITGAVANHGGSRAWVPQVAYGDYVRAAKAYGLGQAAHPEQADLLWMCEPASPLGNAEALAGVLCEIKGVVVLDRAYEPLRLSGACSFEASALEQVWQLWSPNKSLGMTGVRGAYAIAPKHARPMAQRLNAMAPSWPLGAHAVAMLSAWTQPETQHWVSTCLHQLAEWKLAQQNMLTGMGWLCLPSHANYFCAKPPEPIDAQALRAHGIKLRETTSLGLPGHWRMSVQPPDAQTKLRQALKGLKRLPVLQHCQGSVSTQVTTTEVSS